MTRAGFYLLPAFVNVNGNMTAGVESERLAVRSGSRWCKARTHEQCGDQYQGNERTASDDDAPPALLFAAASSAAFSSDLRSGHAAPVFRARGGDSLSVLCHECSVRRCVPILSAAPAKTLGYFIATRKSPERFFVTISCFPDHVVRQGRGRRLFVPAGLG